MKLKILGAILFALTLNSYAAPGYTNSVYSQLTISNMFYTNRIALQLATSNVNYMTTNNYFVLSNLTVSYVSNALYSVTNGNISTNIAVIVPGSLTNRINVTNGAVRSITVLP